MNALDQGHEQQQEPALKPSSCGVERKVQELHAATPLPGLAAEACRRLILAYARGTGNVDWADIDCALAYALAAFSLPDDYTDTNNGDNT